jgi:uncharacterized membrane protein (TIGR02234 family)
MSSATADGHRRRRSHQRVEYLAALVADVLGAGLVLLLGTRYWQTIRTPGAGRRDVLVVSGRAIDAAPTALALVALAGVVAVLATGGLVRRLIGALVALAGVGVIWRSALALSPVDAAHARQLVRQKHSRFSFSSTVIPHVSTHPVWPVLSIACGVLVVLGGVLIGWRGGGWAAMSARYDAPPTGRGARPEDDARRKRHKADAALWSALDRGEDPTAPAPRDVQ